jgi:phage terminase large subunit
VNFSGKAIDPRYYNKRAEMWFEMADWVKKGGALPNIPSLKRELTAPTYTFKKGKFLLEEKEQIKARLGFSPDMADALCLTFAVPDMPSQFRQGIRSGDTGKLHAEFDPFSTERG